MYGVEAGGRGIDTPDHAAPLAAGKPGILHGNRTYIMADDNGQILGTHSISAGLDYPGVGPEHSWLTDSGRVQIGRASCRESVCQYASRSVVAVSLKIKNTTNYYMPAYVLKSNLTRIRGAEKV